MALSKNRVTNHILYTTSRSLTLQLIPGLQDRAEHDRESIWRQGWPLNGNPRLGSETQV